MYPHNYTSQYYLVSRSPFGVRIIGGIPSGLPQLPSGLPQLPSGLPQLPSGLPQLPSGLPQLPSGLPQLPSGLPQLPSGLPDGTLGKPPYGLPGGGSTGIDWPDGATLPDWPDGATLPDWPDGATLPDWPDTSTVLEQLSGNPTLPGWSINLPINVKDESPSDIVIYSPADTSPVDPENVIIACISGRAGAGEDSGITQIRNSLRAALAPLGVKPENIFKRSWNHNQDENPFGAPWLEDLNNEIEQRSKKPSYLAIIGHSYGGWAACKLSRITTKTPDFVGLIDPVFGSTNRFTPGDTPRSGLTINWYQNNGITIIDPCIGALVTPCPPPTNGISCGNTAVPAIKRHVSYQRDWNGKLIKKPCFNPIPELGISIVKAPLQTSHVNIDDNAWIHRQIFEQINSDLRIRISSG
ncbi:hypothetical protein [Halobacillus yeomjeoni]|uniref:Uncharacterized protein n=1 Tax=Halobacillus yeomjeoni TaxID=311194 RepID=A0A931HXQ1_9BACI|nr:hypothetical protein [Halobacillus yeomjeoni]MBH0231366.1 hypothetical protein [Halobacillus yeomjeoni]